MIRVADKSISETSELEMTPLGPAQAGGMRTINGTLMAGSKNVLYRWSPLIAVHLAVIGAEHDDGVVQFAPVTERFEDYADLVIDQCCASGIVGAHQADVLRGQCYGSFLWRIEGSACQAADGCAVR